MVWVAGPISGLIVQPIIGVIADESTSRWGRRRPVIAIGSLVVACSLVALGFTKEIVGSFVSGPRAARTLTIMLAVLSLYVVDFAINAGDVLTVHPPPMPCARADIESCSYVLLEKSGCRHPAHTEAADGRRVV